MDEPIGPQTAHYAMHWLASDKLRSLVASKELTCGHIGVLWFLVDHMDKTCRAWITPRGLARVLNRDEAQTAREVKKLLDHQLIALAEDPRTGMRGYMINPFVASYGNIHDRPRLWGRFKECLIVRDREGVVLANRLKSDTLGVDIDVEQERLQAAAA